MRTGIRRLPLNYYHYQDRGGSGSLQPPGSPLYFWDARDINTYREADGTPVEPGGGEIAVEILDSGRGGKSLEDGAYTGTRHYSYGNGHASIFDNSVIALVNDTLANLTTDVTAWTIAGVAMNDAVANGAIFMQSSDGGIVAEGGLIIDRTAADTWRMVHGDAVSNIVQLTRTATDNAWHWFIARRNGDTHYWNVDDSETSNDIGTTPSVDRNWGSVGVNRDGATPTASGFWGGGIYGPIIYDKFLQGGELQQLKTFLAGIKAKLEA